MQMSKLKSVPRYEGYHQWPTSLASFEVFFANRNSFFDQSGWYWWACFPGCLPDGDAIGPFKSARAAYQNAMAGGDQ
jgi:hypothetical protein